MATRDLAEALRAKAGVFIVQVKVRGSLFLVPYS